MSMEKLISSGIFGMMNSGTAYIIGMIVCAVLSYLIGSVNFTAIFAKKYDAFPDTMGIYKKAGAGVAFGVAALDGAKGFSYNREIVNPVCKKFLAACYIVGNEERTMTGWESGRSAACWRSA